MRDGLMVSSSCHWDRFNSLAGYAGDRNMSVTQPGHDAIKILVDTKRGNRTGVLNCVNQKKRGKRRISVRGLVL